MFRLNISLSDEDYLAFQMYTYWEIQGNKKRVLIYRLIAGFLIFSSFLLVAVQWIDTGEFSFSLAILSVLFILFMVFLKAIYKQSFKWHLANRKKAGKLPYDKTSTLIVEEELIRDLSAEMETTYHYAAFDKIVEHGTTIYLMIDTLRAILIPATAFSDEEQRRQFIAFIEGKIKAH